MRRLRKRGFTLVELMIVVLILGILGGVVTPQAVDSSDEARESALVATTHVVQKAIELYHLQHNGAYPGNLASNATWDIFLNQLCAGTDKAGAPGKEYGPYLRSKILKNPVNTYTKGYVGEKKPLNLSDYGWFYNNITGVFLPATWESMIDALPAVAVEKEKAAVKAIKE